MCRCRHSNPAIVGLNYPYGHTSGNLFMPYYVTIGAQVILYGVYDEELLLGSIERYRITQLPTFPAFVRKLIGGEQADRYDVSSVHYILVGGSALPGNVAKELMVREMWLY